MMKRVNQHITNSALFASAMVMSVLILLTLGKQTPTAHAKNVVSSDGFTMLTAPNGQGTEFLYVIDDNSSMLLVYSIPDPQNRKFIKPEASWLLPSLFNAVRN